MKLIHRIGYYFSGFSVGLIILVFFFNGKHVSCSYGPEARVLKDISTKKMVYNDAAKTAISENHIDSTTIAQILKKGNINFSDSQARKKPCGVYAIEGKMSEKEIILTVENCDSIATILNIPVK